MNEELNQLHEKYREAFLKSMEVIEKEHIRKIHADQFRCSYKCCENSDYSSAEVQECLAKCIEPVARVQSSIEHEVNSFQDRLQRCMMDCSDTQKDKLPSKPSESEIKAADKEVTRCAKNCVDSHLESHLPSLMQRIRTKLKGNL